MGVFFRKSIRVGPFRYNLSKSGIGVSAGIKGLRLGSGPKGNYVHMGRGGIYYRKTLNGQKGSNQNDTDVNFSGNGQSGASNLPPPAESVGEFREIDSGSIALMTSESSRELLKEIQDRHGKFRLFPATVVCSVVAALAMLIGGVSAPIFVVVSVALVVLCLVASNRDQVAKSVVLFFEFDDELQASYESILETFKNLAACGRIRHIHALADVRDKKYHAGADAVVQATNVTPKTGTLPFLKTNIDFPIFPAGRQKLAFLPDRLLVFEPDGVGAVEYEDLKFEISTGKFIESGGAPHDAKVVGQTWKYVNKKGGPDRRFKDNPELPIVECEYLEFTSGNGLREQFQFSRLGVAEPFERAIRRIVR